MRHANIKFGRTPTPQSEIDCGMADISIDNIGKEGETLEQYPRTKFDVVVEMS
jgi:hypothetical protein